MAIAQPSRRRPLPGLAAPRDTREVDVTVRPGRRTLSAGSADISGRLFKAAGSATRFLPRWVGWLPIASGAGLALAHISWTIYIWLLPYPMFGLWVLTVALLSYNATAAAHANPVEPV